MADTQKYPHVRCLGLPPHSQMPHSPPGSLKTFANEKFYNFREHSYLQYYRQVADTN